MSKDEIRESQLKLINVQKEISKTIIGQENIILNFILGIIANGHILIEGAPGLAKTTLIKALSTILNCEFKRIQFTPDLLPSDIMGINMYDKEKGFHIEKGPVFTNLLLADEINRASSKVQSALLESMAEKEVTIGKETLKLPQLFLVFATQNPVESLGTYALPQAQLDRFLFKILMDYPTQDDEMSIIDRTLKIEQIESELRKVMDVNTVLKIQQFVKDIYMDDALKRYIIKIIDATRYPEKYNLKIGAFIEWGAGPRGTMGMIMASKANAFLNNRDFVIDQDIKDIAHIVLRHRILLNYEGQAKKITTDHVITEILSIIDIP
jgi:MoxR-like ATPase